MDHKRPTNCWSSWFWTWVALPHIVVIHYWDDFAIHFIDLGFLNKVKEDTHCCIYLQWWNVLLSKFQFQDVNLSMRYKTQNVMSWLSSVHNSTLTSSRLYVGLQHIYVKRFSWNFLWVVERFEMSITSLVYSKFCTLITLSKIWLSFNTFSKKNKLKKQKTVYYRN